MKTMKRIATILTTVAVLTISTLAAHTAAASYPPQYVYDFEELVKPFTAGAVMMTKDGGKYALNLEREKELTDDVIALNSYAALTNVGAELVYMAGVHEGIGQAVRVRFLARDLEGCSRCAVIVYVGEAAPNGIASFTKVEGLLQKGWGYYEYQTYIDGMENVVAVGILNLDRTSEPQRAAIDNLHITFLDD